MFSNRADKCRENVDYPELIWEDLAYQIDHRKENRSRQSEPESEPTKKNTASRRVVKKKVTLSGDDNIISDDPDAALELAKSISQTEAEEAKAVRKVHATHARTVTESVSKSAKKKSSGRSSKSVVIQGTPSAPKLKPATSKTKLKGAPSLTPQEQEVVDIMQALKESKKTSRRQPGTRGSHEGTGSKLGVPDESAVVSATSSEGIGAKPVKDDKDGDADDEGDDHVSDTQDVNDEDIKTESDEDEIYKYKIRVRNEEDVEMKDANVEESDKGEEKVTDAAKEKAQKTSEAKDDTKKTELPPSSSSFSISLGFGDQFLKLSFDSSLVSTVKDSADADVSSLLEIPIHQETPQTQSPSVQKIPVSVIRETTNLPPIPKIVTETPVSTVVPSPQVTPIFSSIQQTPTLIPTQPITTNALTIMTAIPKSDELFAVEIRVAKLEKDVSELKTVDHSSEALAVLQSQVSIVVDSYLDTKVGDVFQKELPSVILKIKKEQVEKQKKPQFTIKSTDKAALEEYDLKSSLYQSMHANNSFNRNPANHRLYHELMEPLIEDENAMDKGVADIVKDHKRKHDDDEDDDDEDPPAGPNQGKKTKRRKTKESESSKKPSTTKETSKVKEPIAEVVMDVAGDDVVRDDDQPQDTSEPKTRKTPNPDWFKQHPRPPTPDPEWNKR
ncbi:hypothetical protein Tco_0359737 [Tanacetum coccineum]